MLSVVFEIKSNVQHSFIILLTEQENVLKVEIPESHLNSVIYSLSDLKQEISFFWVSLPLFFKMKMAPPTLVSRYEDQ